MKVMSAKDPLVWAVTKTNLTVPVDGIGRVRLSMSLVLCKIDAKVLLAMVLAVKIPATVASMAVAMPAMVKVEANIDSNIRSEAAEVAVIVPTTSETPNS